MKLKLLLVFNFFIIGTILYAKELTKVSVTKMYSGLENGVSNRTSAIKIENDSESVSPLNMEKIITAFSVYPNPVNGGVINTTRLGNYSVYNTMGKLLMCRKSTVVLDIHELQKGEYIIKSDQGNTAMFVKH